MNKYLKIAFRMAILISVVLSGPGKTQAQDIALTKESGVIPPEFNKNNDTLLILKTNNPFYNNIIKKEFLKSYTGAFLIVKKIDKYSLETCRYVFYEGIDVSRRVTTGGGFNGTQRDVVTHGNFRIEDRKTNKNYINPNLYTEKSIVDYLTALDEARKSNQ